MNLPFTPLSYLHGPIGFLICDFLCKENGREKKNREKKKEKEKRRERKREKGKKKRKGRLKKGKDWNFPGGLVVKTVLPVHRVQAQPLVRELRSHMPCSQKNKTWNRSNIVTSSVKTLKWSTLKIFKIWEEKIQRTWPLQQHEGQSLCSQVDDGPLMGPFSQHKEILQEVQNIREGIRHFSWGWSAAPLKDRKDRIHDDTEAHDQSLSSYEISLLALSS